MVYIQSEAHLLRVACSKPSVWRYLGAVVKGKDAEEDVRLTEAMFSGVAFLRISATLSFKALNGALL